MVSTAVATGLHGMFTLHICNNINKRRHAQAVHYIHLITTVVLENANVRNRVSLNGYVDYVRS